MNDMEEEPDNHMEEDTQRVARVHSNQPNGGPYFVASSAASSTSLAGTQSLDGWWGRAKRNLTGINAANDSHLDAGMREAQWRHFRYCIEHSLE